MLFLLLCFSDCKLLNFLMHPNSIQMASFCALLLCRKRLDVHSPNIQFENMSSNATRIHNFEMQPVYIYLLYYYPLANKGVQKLKTYIHSKISDHRMLPVLVNEILSSFTCCKSLLHTCIHLSIDKWQFEGPDVITVCLIKDSPIQFYTFL